MFILISLKSAIPLMEVLVLTDSDNIWRRKEYQIL